MISEAFCFKTRSTYFSTSGRVSSLNFLVESSITPISIVDALKIPSAVLRSASRPRLMASSSFMSSVYFFSKKSIVSFLFEPMAVALYSSRAPLGSVSKRRALLSSTPAIRREVPKGLTPPDWVYAYLKSQIFLDRSSRPIGSS